MMMKEIQDDSKLIDTFLDELMQDKRFCYVQRGVYHAKRAFVIHSVLNWCIRERRKGTLTESETLRYFKLLNQYLGDEIDIQWKSGKIVTFSKKLA